MIHHIVEVIRSPKRDCIYDIIGFMDLGLCVDIGAGLGGTTFNIRDAGGSGTRVVSFEPFPGNHHFIREHIARTDNITLIEKAVGGSRGNVEFVVPFTVQGTEEGWEKFPGYSSVGYVDGRPNLSRTLRTLAKRLTARGSKSLPQQKIAVEMTTIDAEFQTVGESIDFMKIDVQSGEYDVLIGSSEMLRRGMINVMYIEWGGDPKIVQLLNSNGYRIYDSTYMAFPKIDDVRPFEAIGFQFQNKKNLSTGRLGYQLVLADTKVPPSDAVAAVRKAGLGGIQTDLIVVREAYLPRFLTALKRYSDGA